MIEIRCFYQLSDAESYRDAINALNLVSARPDPFSSFEYYERFMRNAEWFPPSGNLRLWLLLAFENDELVGYLALKHRVEKLFGINGGRLEFLTGNYADRPHAVMQCSREKEIGAAFYAYLLGRKKEWSLLEFHQQEDESALHPLHAEINTKSFSMRYWPTWSNGTIFIRWNSIGGYFSALSKKFRSNISRQMRALMAEGDVQILSSSDPRSLDALFGLYQMIDMQSWKDHAGSANSGNPQWDIYFEGLMDPGQLMKPIILIVLLNGMPISGLICGAFDKGLYALNIVYDNRFSRLAPGSLVLLFGVRLAIDGGYQFFDLLSGFGYYKVRWLAQMSDTRSVQIYRRISLHFLKRLLGDARRRWLGGSVNDDKSVSNAAAHDAAQNELPDPAKLIAERIGSDQREGCAALIARARQGEGQFLSSAEIAEAMPFDAKRRIA